MSSPSKPSARFAASDSFAASDTGGLEPDGTGEAGLDGAAGNGPAAPASSLESDEPPLSLPALLAQALFARAVQGECRPGAFSLSDLIIVEAPDRDWMQPVVEVAPKVLFGWRAPGHGERRPLQAPPPPFCVLECTDASERAQKALITEVADTMAEGRAVVLVTADLRATMPQQLRAAADHVLVLREPVDGWCQHLAEAATGSSADDSDEICGAIEFRQLKPSMLGLARRHGQSGADYLRRLASLVVPATGGPASISGTSLTLRQLHGMADIVAWGEALARDMAAYRADDLSWADMDRGALLSGPPGTGKTSVARAIAAHCRVEFIPTSYAEWQSSGSGHLGEVTRAMREVFAKARRAAPAILFIDELDSLPRRDQDARHAEWWRNLVNTLLQELDGVGGREGVVVIAATNYPDRVDPALRRAGRLDRELRVALPTPEDLENIFAVYFGDALAAGERRRLACLAVGHTGADVERWARGARRRARARGGKLGMADVLAEIVGNFSNYPPEYVKRVAVHEAGHAVVLMLHNPLSRPALILGRNGQIGGETFAGHVAPAAITDAEIDRHLTIMMGGRAAEQVICGHVSAGAGGPAGSDLACATRLAAKAEAALGLGSTGLAWADMADDKVFTHQMTTRPGLESAVQRRLQQAYTQAVAAIEQHRDLVEALAAALGEHRVLGPDDVDAIIGHRLSLEPPHGDYP